MKASGQQTIAEKEAFRKDSTKAQCKSVLQ